MQVIAPTWARITGGVMIVAGIAMVLATAAIGLGVLVDEDPIVVVQCDDGLRAVELRPPHPCPPAS